MVFFQQGDIVRVTPNIKHWVGYIPAYDDHIGRVGEVASACIGILHGVYRVEFEKGEQWYWYFPDFALELVEDGIEPGDLSALLKYKDGSI